MTGSGSPRQRRQVLQVPDPGLAPITALETSFTGYTRMPRTLGPLLYLRQVVQ
ncbi:uncharacterized protein FOMMEDRAFT_23445 [Fomitiporia mediterranea MF3/22]|uniref:uncharacterized protein n=1 Tax=Fomitiporia mediterranea (strain MF3/22) TaxID=694068 RepID=UPI0004408CBA|nr:uncharacterized protein FOMMEDRAFT_23445 [Fomitiporia mediterranea MF3/22]EJC98605.1 hypothetical protein FOMMEDRAFT_23445 [Fomitiporia mediterranea MF3/22]